MSISTTFNESNHPREGDGRFAAKDAPESEAFLGGTSERTEAAIELDDRITGDGPEALVAGTKYDAFYDAADMGLDVTSDGINDVDLELNDDDTLSTTVTANLRGRVDDSVADYIGSSDLDWDDDYEEWGERNASAVETFLEGRGITVDLSSGEGDPDVLDAQVTVTSDDPSQWPSESMRVAVDKAHDVFPQAVDDIGNMAWTSRESSIDAARTIMLDQTYRAGDGDDSHGSEEAWLETSIYDLPLEDRRTLESEAATFYAANAAGLDEMDYETWRDDYSRAAAGVADCFNDFDGEYAAAGLDPKALRESVAAHSMQIGDDGQPHLAPFEG